MRKQTFDRIQIRKFSTYYAKAYNLQPPMEMDSIGNMLTIYGSGIRSMCNRGLDIEKYTAHLINHEILHSVIYNLDPDLQDDIDDMEHRHFPFYWGLDLMDGEWFAPMMLKMGEYPPVNPETVRSYLEL